VLYHWRGNYKIISNANTILSRLPGSELTDGQRVLVEAEARFFRALAYRYLVYLYGGVPLVQEEITSYQSDFSRASREETLDFIKTDLMFAAENLRDIAEVKNGKVSKEAANHLLAETALALKQYDLAHEAATRVITNPAVALVKARFGTRANQPGDLYWDMFQRGNQNRASGNREGLFVIQFEPDILGGGQSTTARTGYQMERFHAPNTPLATDPKDRNTIATGFIPTSYIGRGAGWLMPTFHFSNEIWYGKDGKIDTKDIRVSEYNFPRGIYYSNPKGVEKYRGVYFDINTDENQYSLKTFGIWSRGVYPYQTKCTTPGDHPAAMILNAETLQLRDAGGVTYADWYDMRLAETYLLRAEASLGKGDAASAALDLNVIRARAGAAPVVPGEVNIQYILDERMRELGIEEKRRLTLSRLGLLYENTVKYNHYNKDDIKEHHHLFPIPQSEIDANVGSALNQNPGYN
jgi:starch-binding outer membrane protein, SusD/RagB family